MKYSIVLSNRFKKDLKRLKKRQYDLTLLEKTVDKLAAGEVLELKYHDHNLSGGLSGFRECHIAPDWLLVYRIEENDLILLLMRTGTHADVLGM
jgi:mRNA interferase YafQ